MRVGNEDHYFIDEMCKTTYVNSRSRINFDKAKLKHKDKFCLEDAEYIAESSWSKNNKSSDWFRIETVSTSDSRRILIY